MQFHVFFVKPQLANTVVFHVTYPVVLWAGRLGIRNPRPKHQRLVAYRVPRCGASPPCKPGQENM